MPDLSSLGDPQLVVLFQQGNSAAYDTLYRRHFDALCAYAAHSGGLGPEDAMDPGL